MVAKHILTCLQSHDPAISLAPVVDGPVVETEASFMLEKVCGTSSTSSPPTSSGSLQTPELDIVPLFCFLCYVTNFVLVETKMKIST